MAYKNMKRCIKTVGKLNKKLPANALVKLEFDTNGNTVRVLNAVNDLPAFLGKPKAASRFLRGMGSLLTSSQLAPLPTETT